VSIVGVFFVKMSGLCIITHKNVSGQYQVSMIPITD